MHGHRNPAGRAAISGPSLQLFSGRPQFQNFHRFKEMPGVARMPAAAAPQPFLQGAAAAIPGTCIFEGQARSSQGLLDDTHTAALD